MTASETKAAAEVMPQQPQEWWIVKTAKTKGQLFVNQQEAEEYARPLYTREIIHVREVI